MTAPDISGTALAGDDPRNETPGSKDWKTGKLIPVCARHPRYAVKGWPTSDCVTCRRAFKRRHLFTLAIIKGMWENALPAAHFGSLLGFKHHVDYGIAHKFLRRDPKTGGLDLTPAGKKLYEQAQLSKAPAGRATFWTGNAWYDL